MSPQYRIIQETLYCGDMQYRPQVNNDFVWEDLIGATTSLQTALSAIELHLAKQVKDVKTLEVKYSTEGKVSLKEAEFLTAKIDSFLNSLFSIKETSDVSTTYTKEDITFTFFPGDEDFGNIVDFYENGQCVRSYFLDNEENLEKFKEEIKSILGL